MTDADIIRDIQASAAERLQPDTPHWLQTTLRNSWRDVLCALILFGIVCGMVALPNWSN